MSFKRLIGKRNTRHNETKIKELNYFEKVDGVRNVNELLPDTTNVIAYAHGEDPDQPGHPPDLARVFDVLCRKLHIHRTENTLFRLCGNPD